MLIRQPVFLYIDDLREYIADRGKLMFTWRIDASGGILASATEGGGVKQNPAVHGEVIS